MPAAAAPGRPPEPPLPLSENENRELMTVGQLSRRTGLTHKAIRELEGRGLIYTVGRSDSNYRLFDETALWCVQTIAQLRSFGLTLSEIEGLHAIHLDHPDEPIEPPLTRLLDHAHARLSARITELQRTRARIDAYRAANHPADRPVGRQAGSLTPIHAEPQP